MAAMRHQIEHSPAQIETAQPAADVEKSMLRLRFKRAVPVVVRIGPTEARTLVTAKN